MFTRSQVIQALREVVAEQGEDHTAECKYSVHGQPVCIVGHVFYKLGGKKALGTLIEATSLVVHPTSRIPEFERGATLILQDAQSAQDQGLTWGEALRDAEYTYNYTEQAFGSVSPAQ